MKRLMIVTLLISIVCFGTIAMADESETIYAGSDSDAQIVTNGNEVYGTSTTGCENSFDRPSHLHAGRRIFPDLPCPP